MHKVTRSLNSLKMGRIIRTCIGKLAIGAGIGIVAQERYLIHAFNQTGGSVLILSIYITTTHTRHHIDQVKLDDTGNISPLILTGTLCFLFLEFQIHTRSQSHHILTDTIVTILTLRLGYFPVII